jgi:DNA-binding NarL/FixJ family response regulator
LRAIAANRIIDGGDRFSTALKPDRIEARFDSGGGELLSRSRPLRFLIADDHPLFRGALRQIVATRYADSEIAEAGSLAEIESRLSTCEDIDLVLLDLAMPGVRGFSGLMFLRAEYPGVPVVVVSASEDAPTIRNAIGFGASGYIPKSLATDTIGHAVAAILDGTIWVPSDVDMETRGADDLVARLITLTPQQVRVLMMLSEGLLNKQIAYELGVSEATVKAHVSAILQKLRVESRTQAVIAASSIEAGQWPALVPGT